MPFVFRSHLLSLPLPPTFPYVVMSNHVGAVLCVHLPPAARERIGPGHQLNACTRAYAYVCGEWPARPRTRHAEGSRSEVQRRSQRDCPLKAAVSMVLRLRSRRNPGRPPSPFDSRTSRRNENEKAGSLPRSNSACPPTSSQKCDRGGVAKGQNWFYHADLGTNPNGGHGALLENVRMHTGRRI